MLMSRRLRDHYVAESMKMLLSQAQNWETLTDCFFERFASQFSNSSKHFCISSADVSGVISSTSRRVAATCWRSTGGEVCVYVQFTAILSVNELLFQHRRPLWQIDVDFLSLSLHCWVWLDRGNPLFEDSQLWVRLKCNVTISAFTFHIRFTSKEMTIIFTTQVVSVVLVKLSQSRHFSDYVVQIQRCLWNMNPFTEY